MTTAEALQLRARLAGELGRVRALLSRVDALPLQQDGGQRRRLAAADPPRPDPPPALLEAMQRRCAEILTRLRKSKNSVWFNFPVDVEGPRGPSIPYIEKRWKKKRGKSICWSCSKWPDSSPPNLPSP